MAKTDPYIRWNWPWTGPADYGYLHLNFCFCGSTEREAYRLLIEQLQEKLAELGPEPKEEE